MPLRIPIPCSGETHTLDVFIVEYEDGYQELDSEITHEGHSYAHDMSCHEFGYELPECYEYKKAIDGICIDDLPFFFYSGEVPLSKSLLSAFLKAISEQGIEALGLSEEDFASIVTTYIEAAVNDGSREFGEFKGLLFSINMDLGWFKNTKAFKSAAPALARMAYVNGEDAFFSIVNKMFGGGLIRVESEDDPEDGYLNPGSAVTKATAKVFIADILVDEWSFGFIGWFCTAGLDEWHVERIDGSGSAEPTTDYFLKAAEFKKGSEEIENAYKPDRPELPRTSRSGDWVIIHEIRGYEYEWGRLETEEDARWVFDAMRDGSITGRGGWGVWVRLMHIPEGAERGDPKTWEEIESDEL
jgi:hypothetical protein